MAELIVTAGPNTGRHYPLQESSMTIGRSRSRHREQDDYLLLEDPEVSRRHVRLFQEQGQWYVEDLGSTNGSALDGVLLKQGIAMPLTNGGELHLGATSLRFDNGDHAFHMPAESEQFADSMAPDFDLAKPRSRLSRPVEVVSGEENQPDVSMSIDATQFIEQLRGKSGVLQPGREQDLVSRMQAMIQLSLSLGVVTNLDALLDHIMDFVFQLFPGAERGLV
ncbi:MAG: FHA domain-containing protein, partial [Thiohalophilus sp.]